MILVCVHEHPLPNDSGQYMNFVALLGSYGYAPRLSRCLLALTALFFVVCGTAFLPQHALATTASKKPIAQAALAVGDVHRITSTGQQQALKNSAPIFEGDRLVTGPDGMVILVFIDQARVSVRADSELVLTRYQVGSAGNSSKGGHSQPDSVAIQIDLIRGAMRQISGEALKAQPGRYRLNTPVASIGVRGTDFLAKTSSQAVETFIQEGSIVLLPLNNGCGLASDTRSCRVIDTLMASDAMRYLRMTVGGEVERRGVGVQELEQVFGIRLSRRLHNDKLEPSNGSAANASLTAPETVPASDAPSADSETSVKTAAAPSPNAPSAMAATLPNPSQSPSVGRAEAPLDAERMAAEASIRNLIESIPVTPAEPSSPAASAEPPSLPAEFAALPTQMVWGRFSFSPNLPVSLPLPYAEASVGRNVTVGDLFRYTLWRGGEEGLNSELRGRVDFKVSAIEAYLEPISGPASPAVVHAAKLGIDFDAARFESSFRVSHPTTGQQAINAAGSLRSDGLFSDVTTGQRVAGAVNSDGQEAGVFFSKDVSEGSLRGLSLWRAGQ